MDEQERKATVEALNAKGVNRPCPRCNSTRFSVLESSSIQLVTSKLYDRSGPTVPTVLVICENCGFMAQHAKGPLGLK